MLTPKLEQEIGELAMRLGEPQRWVFEYPVSLPRDREWIKKLGVRKGEVLLIVPRAGGLVLVHTKSFYPPGIFRLPSGGVHPGESIEGAAQREAYEELGSALKPSRFVGVVENVFKSDGDAVVYPSFMLETTVLVEPPRVTDPDEPISEIREVDAGGLQAIAQKLGELEGEWAVWGKFRAMPHALLAEELDRNKKETRTED